MLFNSIEYLLFLPIVFIAYWLLQTKLKAQNIFILAASYLFYGLWDYRFLSLILLSSFCDYIIGRNMYNTDDDQKKKKYLLLSLFINLGILFLFKYFNFFTDSFSNFASVLGIEVSAIFINVILPVGISFYTFQTLSYTIDIYKGNLKPSKSLLNFSTFVAFFPQLVAGPIERASTLLPQIESQRVFDLDKAKDGMRQILWGLFKKVVIADNCAIIVDAIFKTQADQSGAILWIGGIAFVIQIYCDFSGYSDIAIGTAKLFGVSLMQNFDNPYFSINTTDLWRRWHISLSTWFRDYVFTPLSLYFRAYGKKSIYISTYITFILIGLWHGGNWTFIIFGLLQAIFLSIEIYTLKQRKRIRKKTKLLKLYYFGSWVLTMLFWLFVCIIFRSKSITSSIEYIFQMFHRSEGTLVSQLNNLKLLNTEIYVILVGSFFLFLIEFINNGKAHSLEVVPKFILGRYAIYLVLSLFIIQYLNGEASFIYFQF